MIRDVNRSYKVACCILSSVERLFVEHDVPWFSRAGITAKGGDWECATCSGIFVWLDSSDAVFNPDGVCVESRTRTYTIETGRCVNESLESPCDPEWYGGCTSVDAGCVDFEITPRIEEPCGDKKVRPHDEAAFLWRDRDVIESSIANAVGCCVTECVGLRCDSVNLVGVTQATEGGCHFVTYSLEVTY